MKALILYRSYHGNTKEVAEALGVRLKERGYEPVVQDVRQPLPDVRGFDIVLNGAPTRIKRANRQSMAVLRKLKSKGISSKPIAIFDTVAKIPTEPAELEKARAWLFPGAAGIMHKHAVDLGLNVYKETLRCEVNGMKGPLVDGAADKAKAFADDFAAFAHR